ncbi:MAG: hypothetical protein AMJ79_14925 [Phycisphaerae bacterium SM23_30]|nr:MAG: hypothetical protein AMJ79_14925 [Phycisphaerae bacterium SM23_30]
MGKKPKALKWESLPEEEILQIRIRDLQVEIAGSELEPLIRRLYEQLDEKGIWFHPPCYLAGEWLTPDREPIIGIPFCLAHPRLKEIEKRMMFEVEGGTPESCMKLLRHECGHAVNYAYQLYKKTRWRELFGPFSAKYSDSYSYQPYSRRFVIHLEDNYAQCHPDEDFAETFAVWLTPGSRWQEKYRGWPVLKKLYYINGLMERLRRRQPVMRIPKQPPWSASRMNSTLSAYYERKRKAMGDDFKGFYDHSLQTLFAPRQAGDSSYKASILLRRNRRQIVDQITLWTGHRKYDIHELFNRFIHRCEALDLYVGCNEQDNLIGVTTLLTTIASSTLRIIPKG